MLRAGVSFGLALSVVSCASLRVEDIEPELAKGKGLKAQYEVPAAVALMIASRVLIMNGATIRFQRGETKDKERQIEYANELKKAIEGEDVVSAMLFEKMAKENIQGGAIGAEVRRTVREGFHTQTIITAVGVEVKEVGFGRSEVTVLSGSSDPMRSAHPSEKRLHEQFRGLLAYELAWRRKEVEAAKTNTILDPLLEAHSRGEGVPREYAVPALVAFPVALMILGKDRRLRVLDLRMRSRDEEKTVRLALDAKKLDPKKDKDKLIALAKEMSANVEEIQLIADTATGTAKNTRVGVWFFPKGDASVVVKALAPRVDPLQLSRYLNEEEFHQQMALVQAYFQRELTSGHK